jgi:maltooligosyltrehalose synthase
MRPFERMNLEISTQDAQLLRNHLARHVQDVENELVRTDKHELQHALAGELERLRALLQRIDAQTAH